MREHIRSVVREGVDSTQRERLRAALRSALAEQLAYGPGPGADSEMLAESVRDRIADHLRDDITLRFRERLASVLDQRISEAVRDAAARTAVLGETAPSAISIAGLH
jgi:hypothetical protein